MASVDLNTVAGLATGVLANDRRALARAITLIENGNASALPLLSALYAATGRAHVVGITGAPGTGKSTLVNAIALTYRQRGYTVGIVAVDPSSPFSGGALLGDRVRMRDLAGDPGIFIRSMATRGSLGGLARPTADVALALDAAGFDRILIETVGVGQSEVEIAGTAHTTIVVEAPGLGDDVQAIKAGILEIADIFAVNKADREGAERTILALKMMLDLGAPAGQHILHHGQMLPVTLPARSSDLSAWMPPILPTIATQQQGIVELVDAVEAHRDYLGQSGAGEWRERLRIAAELHALLRDILLQRTLDHADPAEIDSLIEAVAERRIDPHSAARQLADR